MVKTISALTIADHEKMMQEKWKRINILKSNLKKHEDIARRNQLKAESIQQEIEKILGTHKLNQEWRDRKIARQQGKKQKRAKNPKPLKDVLVDILQDHKKGLPLQELTAAAEEAGYQSNSKQFKNVVYQAARSCKKISHDPETASYRLRDFAS